MGDDVQVSTYLVLRFQMRSELPDVTRTEIEIMWEEAEYVGENRGGLGEKRLNTGHDILLVSQDGVVKTALVEDYHDEIEWIDRCDWCGKAKSRVEPCRKCCGYKKE